MIRPRSLTALTLPALLTLGCTPSSFEIGGFSVTLEENASLTVEHAGSEASLTGLLPMAGTGQADVEMSFGAFRFDNERSSIRRPEALRRVKVIDGGFEAEVWGPGKEELGLLTVQAEADDVLVLSFTPVSGFNRVGFAADCIEGGEPMLGFGQHAMDVDHYGEAFPLLVSEPGIGKTQDETLPSDWYLTGTRHASSYPVPWLLRPAAHHGLALDATARVEVDLCASDPKTWSMLSWSGATLRARVFAAETPLETVQLLTDWTGRVEGLPDWALAPWNDAVRGPDRVREVAATLRAAGAPSSVIWTEDWKGGVETPTGYRLKTEWFLDAGLYPDAEALAQELHAAGFRWFAYFSPFVGADTQTFTEAEEAGALLREAGGSAYLFTGVTFVDTAMVDLSGEAGLGFARDRMVAALDLGFDGWMADYGEWLPFDGLLVSGEDAGELHNDYPLDWQVLNGEVLDGRGVFFTRSGWMGSQGLTAVNWAGDQRTSFDSDDGFPSVIFLGLGASASGVPIFTHDVAGYQSVGNPPSNKELWFRWAALGAFSPILRTHHGAQDDSNWQFDSDAETLDFWVQAATWNMELLPYRAGLMRRATLDGTPMILPLGFVFDGEALSRGDAWMLGTSLLVAPVLKPGVTQRTVELPQGRWFDWFTGQEVESGIFQAPLGSIPVFVREGSLVPVYDVVPDTLADTTDPSLVSKSDAELSRRLRVFGSGGDFTEYDGTHYSVTGTVTGSALAQDTFLFGDIALGGIVVHIDGPIVRTYTVEVVN